MNVFGEYLKGRPDAGAEWDNTMAGIQVCRFSLEVPEGQPPLQLPLTLGALHFDVPSKIAVISSGKRFPVPISKRVPTINWGIRRRKLSAQM